MNKKAIFILGLLLAGLSLCSVALAQKTNKKRQITVEPVSRPSSVMGDIKVYVDGVNGAVVNWETSYELGNLGFNVYRVDAGGFQQMVNDSLIGGSVMRAGEKTELTGQSYSAYDPAGRGDSSYYVETLDKLGRKTLYGPVAPEYARNVKMKRGYNERLRADFTGDNPGLVLKNYPASMKVRPSVETVPPDPVNQKWVAAQPGVKIRVNKDGIYHISKAQLQAAGFNVAASPANWQLYLNGVERKMVVEPAGNFIEFYGQGIDIQNGDFQVYYLIAAAGPGQRIAETIRRGFAPNVYSQNFRNITHYEPRTNYIGTQIINGDLDNWFGPVLTSAQTISRTVNLKDVDRDGQDVPIEIALHGFLNGEHNVQVSLNGNVIGSIQFDAILPVKKTFSVKASNLLEGDNTFGFLPLNGSGDADLLDYISINYQRFFKADQNMLRFDTAQIHGTKVTGFNTANIRVFDLYYENDPMLVINTTVTPGANGFDVAIPSGRAHPMIAVNENSLLSPVSITLNTPSTLSANPTTADMLIVSHGNFMTQSNDWANYRRAQGLTVDVVNVEDVFDEFDYGLQTPEALKSYLLASRAADANLKYVMLAGDATYDPRNYLGTGFNDFIPTKFVDTPYGESPSDETLGDAGTDGVAEMAIGRVPVRVGSDMTLILGKVGAFENNLPSGLMARGAFFVADEPNGWDFTGMNHMLCAELPVGTPCTYVNVLDDPSAAVIRGRIISGVNGGPFLVNYAGHGSTRVWSTKQVLRFTPATPATNDLLLMNNSGGNLSLFLMLTCLNGYFVDLTDDSMAEGVVKLPGGGAPTSWASTGSTTPNIQQEMAVVFFHLLGLGTYERLGDATHAAKLNATSTEVPLTWAIIGDPALKIK